MKDPKELIAKFKAGTCSDAELQVLNKWLMEIDAEESSDLTFVDFEMAQQTIWLKIQKSQDIHVNLSDITVLKERKLWPRILAAASIILILGFAILYYSSSYLVSSNGKKKLADKEITAGINGATLTLSNGHTIRLSSAASGKLAREKGVNISKTSDGQLIYTIKDAEDVPVSLSKNNHQNIAYNTLSTSNGEQYQVVLPDSSKVWLNAASSIRFPSTFSRLDRREVVLSGEAYFEISKDVRHPFIVKTVSQEVRVLGTHFNISSYADDRLTRTTLLKGSVQVNGKTVIKPGEQATGSGEAIKVSKANLEAAMDWKNGDFVFSGSTFDAAMRKIARWYNVEFIYDSKAMANIQPGGWISRKSNISEVLDRIESTGQVHFKIEGRRITVTN